MEYRNLAIAFPGYRFKESNNGNYLPISSFLSKFKRINHLWMTGFQAADAPPQIELWSSSWLNIEGNNM